MIAHHPTVTALAVEVGVVLLLAIVLGAVWWRGRRRHADRRRAVARMRDDVD